MKKVLNYVLALILLVITLFSIVGLATPCEVEAEETEGLINWINANLRKDYRTLKRGNKAGSTETVYIRTEETDRVQAETLATMISVLKAEGYNDNFISAILALVGFHSAFDPYNATYRGDLFKIAVGDTSLISDNNTFKGNTVDVGLFNWSGDRRASLSSWCAVSEENSKKISNSYSTSNGTLKSTNIGSTATQLAFFLSELESVYSASISEGTAPYKTLGNFLQALEPNLCLNCARDRGVNIGNKKVSDDIITHENTIFRIVTEIGAKKDFEPPALRDITSNTGGTLKLGYAIAHNYSYYSYGNDGRRYISRVIVSAEEFNVDALADSALHRMLNRSSIEFLVYLLYYTYFDPPKFEATGWDSRARDCSDIASIASVYLDLLKQENESLWKSCVPEAQANAVVEQLAIKSNYWNEEDLAAYSKLLERDFNHLLDAAKRENLTASQLSGLVGWENNVEMSKNENGLVSTLRKVVMFIGIIFCVWVVFVYIAYWFDRLNTVVYIDLLGIITIGRLHISDDESSCTYSIKNGDKTGKKTVNHRAILTICVIGLLFGTLVVSGLFYTLVGKLVLFIRGLLS